MSSGLWCHPPRPASRLFFAYFLVRGRAFDRAARTAVASEPMQPMGEEAFDERDGGGGELRLRREGERLVVAEDAPAGDQGIPHCLRL